MTCQRQDDEAAKRDENDGRKCFHGTRYNKALENDTRPVKIKHSSGEKKRMDEVRIFFIQPGELLSGIITEYGVLAPVEIGDLALKALQDSE